MSDPAARHAVEDVADETSDDDLEAVAPERSDLPPLRPFNVFATFDQPHEAREAIVALERVGIDGADVSALALDDPDAQHPDDMNSIEATGDKDTAVVSEVGSSVAKGAGIGAVAGALGGTAIAIAIPGVGTAIGAGILAVAAGGAMAGTGVGGFAGALTSTPASKGWEHAVIDLTDGRVVVGVHSTDSEHHDEAMSVLAGAGAVTVRELDENGNPL